MTETGELHRTDVLMPTRGRPLLVVAVLVEAALLALWQRNGYWEVSDGVYAATARAWLHGHGLYRDVAGAQPPPVYVTGLALLAVHDGLASLRAGLGLIDAVTALLTALCVWRLTGRRDATAVAGLGLPLLAITLHEHAQLVPETLAAPLLLGGALLCAGEDRRPAIGGALLAVAGFCKLAFLLPAAAIVLAGRRRWPALSGLIGGLAVLAAVSQLAFGGAVWREAIRAQLQVGTAPLHYVGGLLGQAAWNEFALVIGAAVAIWRWLARERLAAMPARNGGPQRAAGPLMWTLTGAAVAGLVLALSMFKRGSYLDVMVVAEPPLFALAVCGAVWSLERSAVWRAAAIALIALVAVQSVSLLTSPSDPWAARRPGARSGLEWAASPAQVDQAVAEVRRCPSGRAYGGSAYLAFLAGRRMPGDQPDLFMLAEAPMNARFAAQAAGDRPVCPGP